MKRCRALVALAGLSVSTVLSQSADSSASATVLLFGDINLGRQLGQTLLKGEVDYPFEKMKPLLSRADIVFANLESPISDQHGETESPKSNFVFCAPPVAATSLRRGGISIVSTANNHAFDYGVEGVRETIRDLDREHIAHVGTREDSGGTFPPAIVKVGGITIGVLGYTQFINGDGPWDPRIAVFDSMQAKKDIRRLRKKASFIIVSFHGGKEYAEGPDRRTRREMESLARAGADVVVAHHPHVPQGIERYGRTTIFYSLGNFVFNQADPWGKRSFGVELRIVKLHDTTRVASIRLIPLRPYKQPWPGLPQADLDSLVVRLRKYSNTDIIMRNDSLFVSKEQ